MATKKRRVKKGSGKRAPARGTKPRPKKRAQKPAKKSSKKVAPKRRPAPKKPAPPKRRPAPKKPAPVRRKAVARAPAPRAAATPLRATKRELRALESAVRQAGGEAALARLLEVSPSTVRRWRSGALTADGWALLEGARAFLAGERGEERRARGEFRKLIDAASRGDVPAKVRVVPGRTGDAPRNGPLTRGHRFTLGLNAMLTPAIVRKFRAWASRLPKRYPLWQAVAGLVQYGPGDHAGYNTVMFQVRDERGAPLEGAGELTLDAELATPRSNVKQTVIDALAEKMGAAMGNPKIQVFVKYATVFNYRLRTEEEKRLREGFLRRKRRETWKKKRRRQETRAKRTLQTTSPSRSSGGRKRASTRSASSRTSRATTSSSTTKRSRKS